MDELEELARLIKHRNAIAADIASIVGRPCLIGHVGEWIASRVFDIELEESATARGIDGRFRSGALAGRSTNVKWYAKREGLLDIKEFNGPEYYLVLAGPKSPAASSKGTCRPWLIKAVHLFESEALLAALRGRGVHIGIATSVAQQYWTEAVLFPEPRNQMLTLSPKQRDWLRLFG